MTRFWKWNWKDISVIFRVKWTTGGIIDHRGVIHLIMQLTEVMERYQTNHRAIRWRGGLPHKAHRWIFLIQIGDLPCHQGTSSIVLGITIIKTTSLRHIIECLVLTSTISELPIQITSPFLHQIQVEIGVGGVGENLIKHFRTQGRINHVTPEEVKILKIISNQKCYKIHGNFAPLCQFKKKLKEKKLPSDFNIFQGNMWSLSEFLQPGSTFFNYCFYIWDKGEKLLSGQFHNLVQITLVPNELECLF